MANALKATAVISILAIMLVVVLSVNTETEERWAKDVAQFRNMVEVENPMTDLLDDYLADGQLSVWEINNALCLAEIRCTFPALVFAYMNPAAIEVSVGLLIKQLSDLTTPKK